MSSENYDIKSENYDINEGSYHSDSEASSYENDHSSRSPVAKAKRPKSLFDILCNDEASSCHRSPTFLNFVQKPIATRKPHMTNKAHDENDVGQNQPEVLDCKQKSAQNASETTRIRVIPLNRLYQENMQHMRQPSSNLITTFENQKLQAARLRTQERALMINSRMIGQHPLTSDTEIPPMGEKPGKL